MGKMGPICLEAFRERERLRKAEWWLIVVEKKKLEAVASQAKAEEDAWLEAHSQAAAAAAAVSQAKADTSWCAIVPGSAERTRSSPLLHGPSS
jgi:hypothetical protein